MRGTSIALAGLLLTTPLLMPVQADEARSYDYVALGGWDENSGQGLGLMVYRNTDDEPLVDVPRLGGVQADIPAGSFSLTFADAVSSGPGYSMCVFNPDGDNICDGDDTSFRNCGTLGTVGSTEATSATIFIFSIYVSVDLDACVGTTGTVTVG